MRYRSEMALHQILSPVGPLAMIIIGGGPFQIGNTLQSHVSGIVIYLLIYNNIVSV